jgi:hypothetical protein
VTGYRGRWRGAAAMSIVVLLALAAAVDGPPAEGQSAAGPVTLQSEAGVYYTRAQGGDHTTPFGATGGSGAPETWAWMTEMSRLDHRPAGLEFAPLDSDTANHLVLLRHTEATGWRIEQTPAGLDGGPWRGISPVLRSARMAPGGSAVLLGPELGNNSTAAVVARDPGGRFRRLPDPPLEPAAGTRPAERLIATDRAPTAVFDAGPRAAVFTGALGPPVESTVLHWNGTAWSREPVCVQDASQAPPLPAPPACAPGETFAEPVSQLRVIRMSSAGPDDTWLLAEPPAGSSRGMLLFRRTTAGGAPRWAVREIPGGFSSRTPGAGVTNLAPNASNMADPLTATADGLWIDGTFDWQGAKQSFTLFLADGGGRTSWCNGPAPLCDASRPLPATINQTGYQSFAWAGPGFGQRIITQSVPPGLSNPNGTYLELVGDGFVLRPGAGKGGGGAAFAAPDEGWLPGPVHVTRRPQPARLASWALPVRRPLTGVATKPGESAASLDTEALAVGLDGTVLRHRPDSGWQPEFLLTSVGAVTRPDLRGVAWPTPTRAYAVGELGAIWRWRRSLGLWEKDPGAPPNFEGNMNAVAFQAGNPDRGYAVGDQGVLLRAGKGWDPEPLPEPLTTEGRLGGPVDVRAVAFAGAQAIAAAGRHVIVNDGAGWRVDDGAEAILSSLRRDPSRGIGEVLTVAGLPDGGAVAGGSDFVMVRDGAGAPWRLTDQPLTGRSVFAAAAVREGARVRAVVSATRSDYPPDSNLEPPAPGFPPPPLVPIDLPFEGQVVRETASGWRDEERQELELPFGDSPRDTPLRGDPVLAFALDPSGEGWAVGGWAGTIQDTPEAGEGNPDKQTAAAFRYGASPVGRPGAERQPPPLGAGPTRFVVAGHAECARPCVDYRLAGLSPDSGLVTAVARSAELAARPNGPRALIYTGGRLAPADRNNPSVGGPQPAREIARLAELLSPPPGLPVYAAVGSGESQGGTATAFSSAFAGFPAPFGDPGGARTHYAFDSGGVRVIVIDNSRGSLVASDPHQVPREDQLPWLEGQLAAARAAGTPAIVVGHRDLNSRLRPSANVATDADLVGAVLRDGGASAYFFDRPEEVRQSAIPAGSGAVPEYGIGTLGYLAGVSDDQRYATPGIGLVEVDTAKRDPSTNRAPVGVRLLPLIGELAIEAVDGVLLRRSQPALFRGLGRRSPAGRRLFTGGDGSSDGDGSPYVNLPTEPCAIRLPCPGRLEAEHRFTSSDPDIADFVKRDPASDNLRKPLLDPNTDKPIADASSNLLCAFNAGTTTVTLEAGGLRTRTQVTVQPGSVQRPCGTVPLRPDRFPPRTAPTRASQQPELPTAPNDAPPEEQPSPEFDPPALPQPQPQPTPEPQPQPQPAPQQPAPAALPVPVPVPPVVPVPPRVAVPPPVPSTPRPLTGSGTSQVPVTSAVVQPATAPKREEEEEIAPEAESAFVRYSPDDDTNLYGATAIVAIVLLAIGGSTIRSMPRRRRRLAPVTARSDSPTLDHRRRRP